MSANPMQKKARNSFFLGVIITLILCILIGALVYLLLFRTDIKLKENGELKVVSVLNVDVKSGQVLTEDMFETVEVYENMIPINHITQEALKSLSLEDEDGNVLYTDSEGGLYIKDGNKKVSITLEDGKYYKNGEQIRFKSVPVIAKIPMKKNTIVTTDFVVREDRKIEDNTRYVEYNMLVLPTIVDVGDFIDIRVTFPNGLDLIVVSKKRIETINGNTLGFNMEEEEIELLESAIVESYIMTASKLYITQYIEPGNQVASLSTYIPSKAVQELIKGNSNIVEEAKDRLANLFDSEGGQNLRNSMEADDARNAYGITGTTGLERNGLDNLEAGIKQEIENAKKARQDYLGTLNPTDIDIEEE